MEGHLFYLVVFVMEERLLSINVVIGPLSCTRSVWQHWFTPLRVLQICFKHWKIFLSY